MIFDETSIYYEEPDLGPTVGLDADEGVHELPAVADLHGHALSRAGPGVGHLPELPC